MIMNRRTLAGLLVAALAILGLGGTTAANAAPAAPAAPAAATRVTYHTCTLNFGGGIVTTTIIVNSSDGHWGTVTVKTRNTSVPRRVYFDRDVIIDGNNDVWRGVTGSIPARGSADPWTAWDVWLPNAVFSYAMHDRAGNKDWNTCGI